jgi:hypothetical protein
MSPIDQGLLARTTGIYLAVPPFDDLARLQTHFDSVEFISTICAAATAIRSTVSDL